MKRILYFLIPIVLMGLIVFGIIQLLFLQDKGQGALQITTQPLSKVFLNDTFLGNSPLCRCEADSMLKSGEYTLRLEPLDKGLPVFQEKIVINKGVLTVVDRKFGEGGSSEGSVISLEPLSDKKATQLLVLSYPNKATVYVDENESGTTPLLLKDITSSDHTLRLKYDGYKDKTIRIRTPEGYKLQATVYLSIPSNLTFPTPTLAPSTEITPSITPPVSTKTATPSPSTRPNLTIAPSPTVTKTTLSPASGKVTISQTPNGFLRVRSQPTTSSSEIARVSTGQTFPFTDEQNGWYFITLTNGTKGWISGQFATEQ